MAFVTDSNRPQRLWQPPPTAWLTASGAASEVPSLLRHPWGRGGTTPATRTRFVTTKTEMQKRKTPTPELLLQSTGDVVSRRQDTNRRGHPSAQQQQQQHTCLRPAGSKTLAAHNQRLVLWAHCTHTHAKNHGTRAEQENAHTHLCRNQTIRPLMFITSTANQMAPRTPRQASEQPKQHKAKQKH